MEVRHRARRGGGGWELLDRRIQALTGNRDALDAYLRSARSAARTADTAA